MSPPGPLRVALVYARDDEVLGGGADRRVDALRFAIEAVADVDFVLLPSVERRRSAGQRVCAAMYGVPPRIAQQLDVRSRRAVRDRLMAAHAIVAGTTFSLPYVPSCRMERTILDAHNVESEVVAQMSRQDPSSVRRGAYRLTEGWTRAWERQAARRVAEVWAVSDGEAEWFRRSGAASVVVVPNGVDLPADRRPRANSGDTIAFVGSFGSMFNAQAFDWFAREVWPRVRASHPAARLVLAGRGSERLSAPGVDARGFVDDLADVYGQARLAIAPLRSGAGTRLKIVEALAHRVPVVSTSVGADGLGLTAGSDYLLADDPADFAAACVRLLDDDVLRDSVAARGFQSVAGSYTWESIGQTAAARIVEIARTLPGPA